MLESGVAKARDAVAIVAQHFFLIKNKMCEVSPLSGGWGGEKDPSGAIFARGFEKRKPLGRLQRTSAYQGRCSFIPTSETTSGTQFRYTEGDLRGAGKSSLARPEGCVSCQCGFAGRSRPLEWSTAVPPANPVFQDTRVAGRLVKSSKRQFAGQ